MTQQEFYALTGVQVDENEFWAIHEVYCNSDYDKYEFCAMWRKMNRSRVEAAKQEAKAKAQHEADIDTAWRLLESWQCKRRAHLDRWAEEATAHMTARQEQCLNRLGVPTRGVNCPRIMGFVWDDIVDVLHNTATV